MNFVFILSKHNTVTYISTPNDSPILLTSPEQDYMNSESGICYVDDMQTFRMKCATCLKQDFVCRKLGGYKT